MVAVICHKQIARTVQRHPLRIIKRRIGSHTTVAGITTTPSARHRRNDAIGSNFADAMVVGVSNKHVPAAVHSYVIRIIYRCIRRRHTVAGIALDAIARHRADDAVGRRQHTRHIRPVQLPLVGERAGAGHPHAKRRRSAVGHHQVRRRLREVVH